MPTPTKNTEKLKRACLLIELVITTCELGVFWELQLVLPDHLRSTTRYV